MKKGLVLTLDKNESIQLGDDITIIPMPNRKVRIIAPQSVTIKRISNAIPKTSNIRVQNPEPEQNLVN